MTRLLIIVYGKVLEELLSGYKAIAFNHDYLVFFNPKSNDFAKPIKRGYAWKLITLICRDVGLLGNCGTHSL
jgi:hypothetical protein